MSLLTSIAGYWKLDGNSNDSVGSNNGTDTGITYSSGNGKINNGAGFNGSSSKIVLGNNTTLSPTSGDFSISAWIKLTSTGLVQNIYGKPDVNKFFVTSGNKIEFFTEDAGRAGFSVIGVTSLTTGVWYHVVAVIKAGVSMKVYLNGSLEATNSSSIPSSYYAQLSQGVDLGCLDNSPDTQFFHGAIDEVGIWARELTSTDVTALYNAGAGIQYPFVSLPSVTTDAATDLTQTTATLNGEITDIGGSTPDVRGFVYDTVTHGDPGNVAPASSSYADHTTDSGSFSAGVFSAAITGLAATTTYYVRAYAHNSDGYKYGSEVSFVTSSPPPFRFTNIGGVVYDPDDTQTIYAERLNDILERLEALEA